jgi:signal transduction histidine kinase
MPGISDLQIMVVEDNEGDWVLIKEYLSEYCPKESIVHCTSLHAALDTLQEQQFDIILLDLTLPDSFGNESIARVLAHSQEAPVIVLTGYGDRLFSMESLQSGVQDYLLKDEVTSALLFKSIYYSIERNKVRLHLMAEQKKKERDITEAVIAALEKERFEVSGELHDNINQLIISSMMFVKLAENNPDKSKKYLADTHDLLKKAMQDIRSLSHRLAPPDLNGESLGEALSVLIARVGKFSDIQITTEWNDHVMRNLPEKLALNVFRIVQEQLNNIIKHSGANEVKIAARVEAGQLHLTIMDNGIGFDPEVKKAGNGLTNIRTRVSLFRGEMEIVTAPGRGCTLNLSLKTD